MARWAIAALFVVFFGGVAVAQPSFQQGGKVACDNRYPHTCDTRGFGKVKAAKARQSFQSKHSHRRISARASDVLHQRAARSAAQTAQRLARPARAEPSKSLHGVIGPLAEKAEQIVRDCGSWIMSAVRHTQVAGSGRLSCHANGHAVDIAGNPACIYRHLKGWRGGYSTDYSQVRCRGVSCPHVHVSLGCSEDGKRFIHHGTRKHRMAKS